MGNTPGPDSPDGHDDTLTDAPDMPVPPPGTLWQGGSPYLIVGNGQRYTLGWQDTKSDGVLLLVIRFTILDSIKIIDRFPLTKDGWQQAWERLTRLDVGAAQAVAKRIQEISASSAANKARDTVVFRRLNVQVAVSDGRVYTIGPHEHPKSALLGPLAGAEAMVTDGSQAWSPGRAIFLPLALTGLATKTKADAAIVFTDGTVHTAPLDGNLAVREAQRQVLQFNALAAASAPAASEPGSDPAARLQKLQELLDSGLLTQEEYDAKRADIIDSI